MVGFISEPIIKEQEEDHNNQASKPKSFKDPLDTFDPKLTDLSLADSFLDFDSIEEFFEDKPDRICLERIGFGEFDKGMEVDGKGSCVKTHFEEPVVDGSKSIEGGSGRVVKVKEESEEFGKKGMLGFSIEEDMGRVSLFGGLNPVIDSVFPDGNGVKSEVVSDAVETGIVGSVSGSSSVIGNVSGVNRKVMRGEDESESDSQSESESGSSSSSSSSSGSSDDDDEEEEEEEEEEVRVEVNKGLNEEGDIEEGEIRDVDGEEMVGGTNDDEEEEEEEDIDKIFDWGDVDEEQDEEDAGAMTGPIRSANELKVKDWIFNAIVYNY